MQKTIRAETEHKENKTIGKEDKEVCTKHLFFNKWMAVR